MTRSFLAATLVSLALLAGSAGLWWDTTLEDRLAGVEVRTVPRDARVSVGGQLAPHGVARFPTAREVEIVATHQGFREARARVRLSAGRTRLVHLELTPDRGKLALTVKGPKDYSVEVGPDPDKSYRNPDSLELEPGRYRVKVSATGYRGEERWVEVEPSKKAELAMNLQSDAPPPPPKPKPKPKPTPRKPARPSAPAYQPPAWEPPPYTPPPVYRPAPQPVFTPVPVEPPAPPPPSYPDPVFTPIP
ncbi:MAG: hypothetical protein AB1758_01930 [Candidatus Eremiobacterota bacterium]